MNLLTKLGEKFKNIKDDTKKRVLATLMAGGIALSGVGMSACENPLNPNDTNPPIVNPGENNGETQTPGNNGGSQTPGGNTSGGNTSGGNTSGGNNNGGSSQNDYSKYSQILQNVLEDKNNYYTSLISTGLSNPDFAFNHPLYSLMPLGFMEDRGYDINKYKYKELYSSSELYSINNDLYVALKLEVAASTNYLDCYLLKYSLNDKEFKELKKLFSSVYSNHGPATYFQAPFFVQELSYLKTPEILSATHTTRSTDYDVRGYFDKHELLSASHDYIYIGSTYGDWEVAFHSYLIRTGKSYVQYSGKLATITLGTNGYGRININGINIHNSTRLDISGILTDENKEKYEASVKNIICYSTLNQHFADIKTNGDFEKVLGN